MRFALVLLVVLAACDDVPPRPDRAASPTAPATRATVDRWYGLYAGGRKIGWAHEVGHVPPAGAAREATWSIDALLAVSVGGRRREVVLSDRRRYAAAPPHRLVELVTTERSPDGEVVRRYANGRQLVVEETIDGVPRPRRTLPPSAETLADVTATLAAEPAWFAEGPLTIGGAELRLEDADAATAGVAGFDAIADRVAIDRPLGDLAGRDELRLRVRVPDRMRLRDAPNQALERLPDGALRAVLRPIPGLPVRPEERRAALLATDALDLADPEIRALAAQLATGTRGPRAVADQIVRWVHERLRKDPATNLSVASQVLARRAGDCTEHALLFVALARAAGLPAREVSGLVYLGDRARAFGWHAWAEVAIDGRWVMVDPTLGQPVADAGHLTLGVGDDVDWVVALGAVELAVDDPPP